MAPRRRPHEPRPRLGWALSWALACSACGPGTPDGNGDGGDSGSTGAPSDAGSAGTDSASETDEGSSSTDSSDTTSADTTETETETGAPDPVCGNGVVEDGESCDEGGANAWEGAACQPDCTLNECGDGFVGLDEVCDPGTGEPDSCGLGCGFWCGNKLYECGDLIDNDDDGLVDFADPDCLMPCDDAENEFDGDLPSGGADCKLDCAWDPDSGVGNDMCEHNLICDPLDPGAEIGCGYDPNLNPNQCPLELPQQCLDYCSAGAPNGCDCFGCCELDGVFRYIGRDSQCGSDDPSQCALCTPSPSCINPCEPEACELCMLQSADDLAPGCDEPACPDGEQPCTSPDACPPGQFCQTGCCTTQLRY